MTVYRIEFSIQRADTEQDEFEEVGFGSSGSWSTLDACTHMLSSGVTRGEWETTRCMPTNESVMAELDGA